MTITNRQIAGNQRRSLRKIRVQLMSMSAAWDGMDQFNMSQLQELADKTEEVATQMVTDEQESAP